MFRIAHKLGAFSLTIGLSIATSFLVFPVVIGIAGPIVWSNMAVAQSVAALGSVVVSFGWGVTGPAEVAGLPSAERGVYYAESLASRVWLLLLVAPIVGVVVWLMYPSWALICVLSAYAALLSAVSGSWFFVGEARPWRLLAVSTLPAVVGTVGLCWLLWVTSNLVLFVSLQVVLAVLIAVICAVDILRRHPLHRVTLSPLAAIKRLRGQTASVITSGTAAIYVNGPLIIASAIAPSSAPIYAMADRLLRYTRIGLGPVTQVSQGYVPAGGPGARMQRARRALLGAAIVGTLAGVGFTAVALPLSQLLSLGEVGVPLEIAAALGVSLLAVSVSSVLGLSVLTSLGYTRIVAQSTVVAALLGTVSMLTLGMLWGIIGVAISVALAEIVVVVYQAALLPRAIRGWARATGPDHR